MWKQPAQTPAPREVRGERQALTVSQPRCEGSSLQSLGLLVQELYVSIDPLLCGVRTDLFIPLGLEDHSCQGTLGASILVTLQHPQGDLPLGERKAAGNRRGHLIWLSQLSWADSDSYEQQAQKHCRDLHVEGKDFGVKAGVVWVGLIF